MNIKKIILPKPILELWSFILLFLFGVNERYIVYKHVMCYTTETYYAFWPSFCIWAFMYRGIRYYYEKDTSKSWIMYFLSFKRKKKQEDKLLRNSRWILNERALCQPCLSIPFDSQKWILKMFSILTSIRFNKGIFKSFVRNEFIICSM